MGRPPSEKPRQWLRLSPELWATIMALAKKNHRTKDLQIEAMLEDWLYATTGGKKEIKQVKENGDAPSGPRRSLPRPTN